MIPTFQQAQFGRSRAGNHAARALRDAMVSYWQFDENDAGTTYADALGNFNMTARNTGGTAATNTVTTSSPVAQGQAFNAGLTEGRTAYIPVASSFALPDSAFSFGGWFSMNSTTAGSARWIMGNPGSSGTNWQARILQQATTNDLLFQVSSDGSAAAATVDSNVVPTVGVPMLLVITLDRDADTIYARWQKENSTVMGSGSAAFAGALYTGSVPNFNVNDGLSGDSTYFSGTRAGVSSADCCFYMTGLMTDEIFAYLFNGDGTTSIARTWAEILADAD